MKALLILAISLVLTLVFMPSAHAGQICFQDVRGYEAVEKQLPIQLRGGQLYAVHNSWTMKGGFRVYAAGSKWILEGKGRALILGSIDEDATIQNLCVNGDQISVWLEDGRYDSMTIVPDGLIFHGYMFSLTTPDVYARVTQAL